MVKHDFQDADLQLHLENDGTLHVKETQDVEPVLESNKSLRQEGQRSEWGQHVASIPNVILTRWLNEEWQRGNTTITLFGKEMDELVERKLKDPDWAYLRTDSKHTQAYLGWSAPILGTLGFSS